MPGLPSLTKIADKFERKDVPELEYTHISFFLSFGCRPLSFFLP